MSDEENRSSDNIIAGPVLLVIAILALWYNEGRFDHSRAARRTVEVHKVFRNLAKLALIDGTYDKRENKFLTSWGSSMGLADETMQALFEAARTDPRIGLDATAHEDLEPLITARAW